MNRRDLLRLIALAPLTAASAGCGGRALKAAGPEASRGENVEPATEPAPIPAAPSPVAVPEPVFVLPAGEDRRALMAATKYETPLYIFASGRPGKIALALGGVHGNEPGGWLAADRIVDNVRPENGALLVIPRANKVAVNLFERTTEAMGDLNRSYPGFEDGLPMERMAVEIMNTIREFHVDLVHDMHESWAFYRDRTTNGTAFLGQTVSTNGEAGTQIVKAVIDRLNPTVLYRPEEFFFRDFGGQNPSGQPQPPEVGANLPRQTNSPPPGHGTSSLGINRYVPGLVSILVEMGQQQGIDRRIALHVQVLKEVLNEIGVGVAQT